MARSLARHPFAVDALIAAAAFTALLLDVSRADLADTQWAPAVALSAVMAGSLAWRRRAPLTSYVIGGVALALQATLIYTSAIAPYVNLFGIYSAALYATRLRAPVALAAGLLGVVAYFSAYEFDEPMLPLSVGVVWAGAWAAGYGVARRREDASAQRAVAVREAAFDERRRIARELHDLVGHTVNVMVVQAGAARRVLDRDPDRARDALHTLERIGRGALDELDRVLGVLRDEQPTGADDWQPPTGLADIGALADRFVEAGLAVTIAEDGPRPADVPRSLDVSAYRIVQEALTNTLKHADADRAHVDVRYRRDDVRIVVRDDGTGGGVVTPGRGLTGMAERVAVFGGRLDYRGGPDGFELTAVLPLGAPAQRPPAVSSP